MFKRLIVGTLICLAGALHAQTDALNAQKYWKFRNNFRQDFIKIGADEGQSIPIASRQPLKCQNNDGTGGDGLGMLRWGDGMIFQGHYIGFLATEYRLLKDRGQSVEAILNELYYALTAINRVDRVAERIISEIDENGLPVVKGEDLNGFYLRDDTGEDMYKNWENADIKCRCTIGSSYQSNNTARINDYDKLISRPASDPWSTPSLDQMTSLLVGLSMCHKLLEDELYVQPTPSDSVMNLKAEAIQITHRLISYASEHNWFLLNEWGWPEKNGGGDLAYTAYPINKIGRYITGIDYTSLMYRRTQGYKEAREYYTLPEDQRAAYFDGCNTYQKNQINNFPPFNIWPYTSGAPSNFEIWQGDALYYVELPISASEEFWYGLIPEDMIDLYEDWEEDYMFDNVEGIGGIGSIPFPMLNFKDYNITIMFNLGVASGIFTPTQVAQWGAYSENYELVLVDAILHDHFPELGSKEFYQNLLNSMPDYGGFKFHGQEWYGYKVDGNDSVGPKQIIWPEDWGGEYKWNDALEANSISGGEGQLNPLDYMYLHNLYYLVYGHEIPTPYEETYDCFCGDVTMDDIYPLQSATNDDIVGEGRTLEQVLENGTILHENTVKQLEILEFCTKNVFTGATTTSTKDIKQLFDDYHDIGISLNKYQTQTHTVSDGGEVNIESRLVICEDKVLNVLEGGEINLDKGEILIKAGASLVVEGIVNIGRWTKVIVEDSAKIVIKNGGRLNNNGNIRVKKGATFEYEEGAILSMTDNFAEIHFDGGDLIIRENADFTFIKGATQSGQLRFSTWGAHIIAEENTSFLIQGNGLTDPILVLDEDADFWSNSTDLNWITMSSGQIDFHNNSRLVSIQPYTANNIHFNGLDTNRGVEVFSQTSISNSVFDTIPIYAPLFYKNAGTFDMTLSEINNSADQLVKIKGMGYNISHTTFNGSGYYLLSAQNTTVFSRVSNCEFNGDLTTVGIIDNSNAEIEISKNTFNDLYAGVHKLDGQATMKCNTFDNFSYAGIVAHNDCVLDISSNALGGYNTFVKNDANFGQNIALWNTQSILLNNGYNTFDGQGTLPIIKGSLQISPPVGLVPVVPAHANKWNPTNSVPSASRFNITSATGSAIMVLASSPNGANCPDPTDDLVSGVGFNLPVNQGTMPVLQTLHFNNIGLANALDICIEATEQYGGANDLNALELFEEVLSTYPSMPASPLTNWLVQYGAQKMKNTLQHLFANGTITQADNTTQFHTAVQRYVHVLNVLTSVNLGQANYKQLFSLEMDKAHLFHLIGKPTLAILTLLNAESCGLDSTEQAYVNHWKFEMDEEVKKMYYGYTAEFLDTTWIDTTQYITPTHQNFGNFGSYINSINSIEFYNCNNYRAPITENPTDVSLEFTVYPNPNQGIFTVSYALPEESTGDVTLFTTDGKQVYRFECRSGEHRQVVDLSGIASGTYLYTYTLDGETVKQGKFIIQ